jgi:glycosyltransferase involved in cell wall biosynthesis
MSASVSIVLTAFKRAKQLEKTLKSITAQKYAPLQIVVVEDGDDGVTRRIASDAGAQFIQKKRTDLPVFQNPSRVHNMGIRAAKNDIVILQGAEVCYTGKNDIERLVSPIEGNDATVATPYVASLSKDGNFHEWFVHPSEGTRAGWIINFCLAMRRDWLLAINGFEESFRGYGFEDDYLMYCLARNGARFQYVKDVLVQHQWHDRGQYDFSSEGSSRLADLIGKVGRGEIPAVANYGREWGQL